MTIKELEVRFNGLESKLDALIASLEAQKPKEPVKAVPVGPESQYPVPSGYRAVVDEILNAHFGITCVPKADAPEFELTIIVPEKYSPTTREQRANLGGYDIRPRVINNAEGLNGVKMWVEKVLNSFTPEVKSQIYQDKFVDTL